MSADSFFRGFAFGSSDAPGESWAIRYRLLSGLLVSDDSSFGCCAQGFETSVLLRSGAAIFRRGSGSESG